MRSAGPGFGVSPEAAFHEMSKRDVRDAGGVASIQHGTAGAAGAGGTAGAGVRSGAERRALFARQGCTWPLDRPRWSVRRCAGPMHPAGVPPLPQGGMVFPMEPGRPFLNLM